jgi:hypothetical protein
MTCDERGRRASNRPPAPSTIPARRRSADQGDRSARDRQPETVAKWERPLFTPAECATRVWLWRTRHAARRLTPRTDSPRRPPCSFGLHPEELRRHAAQLLAQGWTPDEVHERLDLPANGRGPGQRGRSG